MLLPIFFNTKESSGVSRSSRQSKLPAKLNDYKSFEPKTYEEAALDKNWVQAINDEMQALYENNAWILTGLPKNKKAIGSKRVFRIKYKSICEIDRYKARLVAKRVWWNFVALLVYVDDILVTGNDVKVIDEVKTFLSSKFKIKDLGELKYFLGIEPMSTPLPENIVLAHKESDDDNRYMHAPLQSHLDIALMVLKYLKGALGSGVEYEKSEHMSLKIYADSGWANKKQATLFKSSAEAEYRSMAAATCEVMWIVNILKDLKVTNLLHAELYCDNSAAIQIAANRVMHEKTKHFDLDVHIIREKVASGLIKTAKVDSENQIADIFTKVLGFPQHNIVCFYRGRSGNVGYTYSP
ncbi:ribonuclease H-like domain-containing protein [Tanacetum coccineum]